MKKETINPNDPYPWGQPDDVRVAWWARNSPIDRIRACVNHMLKGEKETLSKRDWMRLMFGLAKLRENADEAAKR